MSSAKADTLLPVEDRARRSGSRQLHEQDHQRQPDRQRKPNTGNMESGFPRPQIVPFVVRIDMVADMGPALRQELPRFARSVRSLLPK